MWDTNSVRGWMRTILRLVLVITPTACSASGGAGSALLEAAIDTIDGIETLRYPESPAPRLSLRIDTIGTLGGALVDDPEYQFTRVSRAGLAGDADGTLFVLDGAGHRVQMFDASGAYVASFGSEGSGPGELQTPSSVNLGPGDTLWIPDVSNRRTNLIPIDGGAPRSIAMPDESSNLGGSLRVSEDGFTGLLGIFSFSPDQAEFPPFPLVRFSPTGELTDTLWKATAPQRDLVELESNGNRMLLMMTRQFSPSFHWGHLSDGRFVLADGAEYDFSIIGPTGQVLRSVRRDPPARATTQADRERVYEVIREQIEEAEEGQAGLHQQRLEKTTFEDTIPRITGIRVDSSDRIWVGVSGDTAGVASRIDVYDASGELLGEIIDDPFLPDLFYGGDRICVLAEDELDVQQVLMLRWSFGDE